MAIFQLGDGGFPPLKTISNTNLPRPASSFVGREAPSSQTCSRSSRTVRASSRSPARAARARPASRSRPQRRSSPRTRQECSGSASPRSGTPALVGQTIAQTLGSKNGLAEHIGERELLLLLDNLEQVIEASPELGELLQSCPNLPSSSPSRERLRVAGEVEYPVPPLAEPEAVALFCERSQLEPSDGDGRALLASRQPPARRRARCGTDEGAQRRPDPRAPRAASRPAQGRPRRRSAPADPARDDRVELRPPLARRAGTLRPPLRLRRRLHARGCRARGRRRPRHPPVARREKPRPLHQRALLDARDGARPTPASGWSQAARKESYAGGMRSRRSTSPRPRIESWTKAETMPARTRGSTSSRPTCERRSSGRATWARTRPYSG